MTMQIEVCLNKNFPTLIETTLIVATYIEGLLYVFLKQQHSKKQKDFIIRMFKW